VTVSATVHRLGIVVLMVAASAARVLGQAGPPEQAQGKIFRNDSDPTRPVLFSLRPEIYNPSPTVTQTAMIFRYDRAQLAKRRWLPGKRGVLLRFEMPLSTTAVTDQTKAGLGDAYAQFLTSPYFTRRFAFLVGSGLRIPTATDTLLGTGKWVAAPAVAPVWFFDDRGLFFFKVQNFSSIAGDGKRPDINFLLLTPTWIHRLNPTWWLLADAETRTDWERNNATAARGGLQVGHAFSNRFALWVKPEAGRDPDLGTEWNLKFGLVWFR
jgi:hypothetical protein